MIDKIFILFLKKEYINWTQVDNRFYLGPIILFLIIVDKQLLRRDLIFSLG